MPAVYQDFTAVRPELRVGRAASRSMGSVSLPRMLDRLRVPATYADAPRRRQAKCRGSKTWVAEFAQNRVGQTIVCLGLDSAAEHCALVTNWSSREPLPGSAAEAGSRALSRSLALSGTPRCLS